MRKHPNLLLGLVFVALAITARCSNPEPAATPPIQNVNVAPASGSGLAAVEPEGTRVARDAEIQGSNLPPTTFNDETLNIQFAYNSDLIQNTQVQKLESHGVLLLSSAFNALTITGHCDERGSDEYNVQLGQHRAEAVKRFLIRMGIPESKMQTASMGEESPICLDRHEGCWSRNRRVELQVR